MKRLIIVQVICLLYSYQLPGQKILFVGNSLTYSNDLPLILEHIAKTQKLNIKTSCICFPNYSLEDHWFRGELKKELSRESYDYLIMQQGPSSQAMGREWLIDFGKKIKDEAVKYETKTAYFMVWPSRQYYHTFDGVIKNHSDAASINNAILIPVGSIWKKIQADHPEVKLYGPDGFHPSTIGSFLSALVMLHTIHPEVDIYNLSFKKNLQWVKDELTYNILINEVNEMIFFHDDK